MSRVLGANKLKYGGQNQKWLILLGSDDYDLECAKILLNHLPSRQVVVLSSCLQLVAKLVKNNPQVIDGGNFDILSNLEHHSWAGIILGAKATLSDSETLSLIKLKLNYVPVYHICDVWESLWLKLPPSLLDANWFVASSRFQYANFLKFKRLIDILVSMLLLIILLPLMLLVAVAIKLDSPGEIIYSQLRNGRNGRVFKIYKFRSMYTDAEKTGVKWTSIGDSRITRIGYWLRTLRIDELPQLWNVLIGEMSLIGPRPERPEFDVKLKNAIPYYQLRYLVKPGISGWAQVLYPYGASVEDAYEKLAYDLYYIKNYSLWLDIVIFFKTIKVVLCGKGR
ncbi:exopolysaccharide biosynthesis polyprenyl glycosylphosphotransferase [Pseudanabaena sp. FACHB-1277]|jgi:exopolysaccharide biosynthesis polyprenyl glycosylphosphotransferase|uniref:Exopolysaccharide biosynthesis polyprenyl glycosylphosphotransferase n=2 Tax=Pseudanabaena TaxID=1152 RepID=A0A926UU20_9CYAN|nr:exopolysaccharide biosynthesis polyprenyl glycosylphosphotransferase [Pseudanabaena cinerea FACHB-1277]